MGVSQSLAKLAWSTTSETHEDFSSNEAATANDNNLETFSLIWLDADVNSRKENINGQQRIRSTINYVKTFEKSTKYESYIQSIPEGDRTVLIVSGRLGREVVPRIHQIQQLSSIYVFCFDTKTHSEWARKFPKVKGVFNEIDDIILQIQLNRTQRTNARIEESFASAFQGKSSAGIDGNVVYSQIMVNVLIRMISSSTDRNELISICRKQYQGNQHELAILHEFEQNYLADKALWWYSRESFLYRILNKALRVRNIDLLYSFRFFIRDLRMQLEQNQWSSRVIVYRDQFMSKDEIEFLRS
ncbi:unnamed protein product [Rotaria sordida]|uniref:Uncharacterized protein n=1 Tax=Rotaria sordida TaxID=392033 RepID=A0A814Y066_9BILA|nr:unnamed protein product [Rotaria sordida]CAF1503211.1 unnamed protein product [Rotaria sordida]